VLEAPPAPASPTAVLPLLPAELEVPPFPAVLDVPPLPPVPPPAVLSSPSLLHATTRATDAR